MTIRLHTTLLLALCTLSTSLTACDAPGDEPLAAREDLAMAAFPAVETESEPRLHALDDLTAEPRVAAGKHGPSEKLAKKWVQWALSQPWSTGPVNDPTGASCAMGQQGSVWFLAGTSGGSVTRECTVPPGKKLFVPLVNSWWTFPEEFYPDEDAIEAGIPDSIDWLENNFAHVCSLTLRLDGEDVIDGGFEEMVDELYVETFDPFEIDLHPSDHFMSHLGVAGGEMLSTGAGFYARIKPLAPGDHVLEFGGSLCEGEELWFETLATYHLHVGP